LVRSKIASKAVVPDQEVQVTETNKTLTPQKILEKAQIILEMKVE
jgi:hypothetical protein